jgi:hypothetical protein
MPTSANLRHFGAGIEKAKANVEMVDETNADSVPGRDRVTEADATVERLL